MAKVINQVCESLVEVLQFANEDAADPEFMELINLNKNDVWGLINLLETELGMSPSDILETLVTNLEIM